MDMLYRLAIRRGLGRKQGRDTRVERKEKTRKKLGVTKTKTLENEDLKPKTRLSFRDYEN